MYRLPNRLALATVVLAVVIGLVSSSLANDDAGADPTTTATVDGLVSNESEPSASVGTHPTLLYAHLDDAADRIGDLQSSAHEGLVVTQRELAAAEAAAQAAEAERIAAQEREAQAQAEAAARAEQAARAEAQARAEQQAQAAQAPPAPPATTPPAPAVAAGSIWDTLAQCETGGNWATNSVPGFSGGLGFAHSSWAAFGGTQFSSIAAQATREQQIVVAERILASVGWRAWPGCSVKLGLR